jgi:ferredoxin
MVDFAGREQLTSAGVKKAARHFGADLVGIGSIGRWERAPAANSPKSIMPKAKSVICLGFRIHRGSLRGVEEQTYFSTYTLTGFSDLNFHFAPFVQRRVASFIEDCGYEAAAVLYSGDVLGTYEGQPTGRPARREDGTEKPAPDIFLDFRIAGVLCGIGQIGLSRVLLTPEFGPAQRLYFLVTDAPLAPDPILAEPICDGCRKCVRNCPTHAISATAHDDVDVPGVAKIKRAAIDILKCRTAHIGGAFSQFAPEEVRAYAQNIIDGSGGRAADGSARPNREEMMENVTYKVGYALNANNIFHSPSALCGGESCVRDCLAHLEAQGRLTRKFRNPFRDGDAPPAG